jgi:NAD(P)H dehydrogenase (quinone)
MTDPQVKVAVVYYSSTGTTHAMAQAAAEAAEKAGAEVRLRRVAELAPDGAIRSNEQWSAHRDATRDIAEATLDDLEWADALVFGTPTRFGVMASQLKQYLDGAGPLWAQGKLANKIFAGFCSTATEHGGQESTLLSLFTVAYHWGSIVVTPGYTQPGQFESGNPYGGSHTSGNGQVPPDQRALDATGLTAVRAVEVAGALKRGSMGA